MHTGKSDVEFKGIEFVLQFVVFDTLCEAVGAIGRWSDERIAEFSAVMEAFNADCGSAVKELNNHVRHRATQGKKQVLRDAYTLHQAKKCAADKAGNATGCGKAVKDCAAIKSAILLCQEFSRDHIPPSGTRSKGPVTQAQAKDLGMALAGQIPANLLDRINRGEITILEAVATMTAAEEKPKKVTK